MKLYVHYILVIHIHMKMVGISYSYMKLHNNNILFYFTLMQQVWYYQPLVDILYVQKEEKNTNILEPSA